MVNRCLESYLRCFAGRKPNSWSQWFHWTKFWYNSSYHSALKMSPIHVLYGCDHSPLPPRCCVTETFILIMQKLFRCLRNEMISYKAQKLMQSSANKHRHDVQYQLGDWVYLELRLYRQSSVAQRRNEKLESRFFGPYQIKAKLGLVAYRLKLPSKSIIHHVFYVSQLKQAVSGYLEIHTTAATYPLI